VLVVPLAAASPPDPTWIAGFWDDDDFDDVVTQIALLASTSDTAVPAPPVAGAPSGRPAAAASPPLRSAVPLSLTGRAPPLP
jgi:hypothetical protein